METLPLISVIVPIYNVENFLPECVESIRNQTYKNLEIILVDDGSTDNCGKMCDYYAVQDSRIHVIHKANGGLSDARNCGLDNYQGKYFAFVDSDDTLDSNFIEVLYTLISSGPFQLAQVGTKRVSEDTKTVLEAIKYANGISILDKKSFIKDLILYKIHPAAWCNLYDGQAFKDIRFTKGEINEDVLMWLDGVEVIDKAIVSSDCLYNYRMRDGSIVHSDEKKLINAIYRHEKLWLKKIINEYPKLEKEMQLTYFFYFLRYIMVSDPNDSDIWPELKNSVEYFFKSNAFRNTILSHKIKIVLILLKIFPRGTVKLLRKKYVNEE